MVPSLKALVALLSLLQLISSTSVTHLHTQTLKEIIHQVRQLNSGVQVPCNDTRVAQVDFMDPKPSKQELLCQAAKALTSVTRCRKDYEPLVSNLRRLQGRTNCSASNETELYLLHFLPALENFTQGLYRLLSTEPAQRGAASPGLSPPGDPK
ncbi:interleukin-4-like protein [Willisornis vidua]|uniref:Interleukin-4 n=1 Tax=Willisornis vidua TaxID=1566151 RepID=A0ABQ9DX07_9PASS|nr:interleukin-4-like protein [Willisornis vidua]